MSFKDTANNFICSTPMMYASGTPTETLQEHIEDFNKIGMTVAGAYRTRGVPFDESSIIMYVVKGGTQKSADELLTESIGNKPWFVDEFLSRR